MDDGFISRISIIIRALDDAMKPYLIEPPLRNDPNRIIIKWRNFENKNPSLQTKSRLAKVLQNFNENLEIRSFQILCTWSELKRMVGLTDWLTDGMDAAGDVNFHRRELFYLVEAAAAAHLQICKTNSKGF